jgi:hypothetical protein|tara:strand:- start:26677 stop:27057 length:381 start_codon:yes stop_codon:yes gene_type:complete
VSEDLHQEALFKWAAISNIPELELMHHIPNGGHRNKRTAARLKAQGVKSGVPDVFLPVARGGFHGLYIEMKKPKDAKSSAGKATANQLRWQTKLNDNGYMAVICVGWEAAKDTIIAYLNCEEVSHG